MTFRVPYIPDDAIERDAEALLAQFAHARGVEVKAPVPIEDIVEKHLKLRVEFDDTHKLFGIPRDPECDPDILGAIFFDEARIVIDESLDPEENPAKEGRYRFTLAHEGGGHWRLHRHLFAKDPTQAAAGERGDPRLELAVVGGGGQERPQDLKAQTCPSHARARRVSARCDDEERELEKLSCFRSG